MPTAARAFFDHGLARVTPPASDVASSEGAVGPMRNTLLPNHACTSVGDDASRVLAKLTMVGVSAVVPFAPAGMTVRGSMRIARTRSAGCAASGRVHA